MTFSGSVRGFLESEALGKAVDLNDFPPASSACDRVLMRAQGDLLFWSFGFPIVDFQRAESFGCRVQRSVSGIALDSAAQFLLESLSN